jgi:LmbE family N-acetylglucosaminyl deacetylase
LGLPDGQVAGHVEQLADALSERGRRDDLWVAPWTRDGHPDHDACGRVASEVAEERGVRSLGYLVWAWHWADPNREDLPWDRCVGLALDQASVVRKLWAIRAFRSQIRPLGADGDDPVLPPAVLRRFQRRMEVFVDGGAG